MISIRYATFLLMAKDKDMIHKTEILIEVTWVKEMQSQYYSIYFIISLAQKKGEWIFYALNVWSIALFYG